jgi:hypothetical protein
MPTGKKGPIAAIAAVAVLLVAAIAGVIAFRGHQQRTDHSQTVALVADATEQLRQALTAGPSKEIAARIDGHLQSVKTLHDTALADAAENYLLGAREIVRRRADSDRLEREAAASRQALASHMRRSDRRGTGWIRDAADLQRKVERDHTDLARSLRVLDELIYSLEDAEKKLAPHVGASQLLDAAARQAARARAQEAAKRAADELQKTRRIGS